MYPIKTIFAFAFIILDVAMFPFSCSDNKKMYDNCLFNVEIKDEEHQFFYETCISFKIPEDRVVSIPDDIKLEWDDYEVKGWYVFQHEMDVEAPKEYVSFPYTIQDEDILSYWQANRNSVVFMVDWEYIGK